MPDIKYEIKKRNRRTIRKRQGLEEGAEHRLLERCRGEV